MEIKCYKSLNWIGLGEFALMIEIEPRHGYLPTLTILSPLIFHKGNTWVTLKYIEDQHLSGLCQERGVI